MLGPIAIVPSAPLLVPELAGVAAEAAQVREAVLAAARTLPPRWIAVGSDAEAVYECDSVGSFAGFGADVPVRLSPCAQRPVDLSLCALVAGWIRGQVSPEAEVPVYCFSDQGAAVDAAERLRVAIDREAEAVGVLLLADGANTVSPIAPGGYQPADIEIQDALDNALAGGDIAALTALPPQVTGRAGFAALAGLAGAVPRSVTQLYRDAPYGVGYFVGVWQT